MNFVFSFDYSTLEQRAKENSRRVSERAREREREKAKTQGGLVGCLKSKHRIEKEKNQKAIKEQSLFIRRMKAIK